MLAGRGDGRRARGRARLGRLTAVEAGSPLGWALGLAVPAAYVLGALSAVDAVMHARTPQGATAWAVALVSFPFVALAAYWAFGRSRFEGYVKDVRLFDAEVDAYLRDERAATDRLGAPPEAARDERFERAQFFEAAVTHHGFRVRAFVEPAAAVAWLDL